MPRALAPLAPRWLLPAAALPLLAAAAIGAGLLGAVTTSWPASGPSTVPDIPAEYLAAYESSAARYELGDDGWTYLAAIGKLESDHGRSTAPGVHAGQNTHGCCAGPMQIHNGFGSGGGTWGAFKQDGDGDGREDIYNPADAIATAAHYLRASGAPGDWRLAIFAYNHADWYVEQVVEQAAAYRAASSSSVTPPVASGAWLVAVPGTDGERCDARIVPDVLALLDAFGLRLTACFGGAPHAIDGEHPLGLASDLVPADGDWSRTMAAARALGWSPDCAASGCAGRGPLRVVLYNGYPGHGDPAHSSTPHLHLSWQHAPTAPFTRARMGARADPARLNPYELRSRGGPPVIPYLSAETKVHVTPDPSGLPGSNVLQSLVNGLAFWMLLASLAGVLIGAGVWALASHGNNHHWASRGRAGALVSAAAALVIGASGAIVNFFVEAGGKVK